MPRERGARRKRCKRKKIQWTPAQEKGEGKTKGLVGNFGQRLTLPRENTVNRKRSQNKQNMVSREKMSRDWDVERKKRREKETSREKGFKKENKKRDAKTKKCQRKAAEETMARDSGDIWKGCRDRKVSQQKNASRQRGGTKRVVKRRGCQGS